MSYTDPNTTDYESSLDSSHILFEYAAGSAEYQWIFGYFSTRSLSYYALNGKAATEKLEFYKEMNAPSKEGYTFTGWYYDEACTRPYQGEPITSDVNLYAGFEINKYKVTFDASAATDDPNEHGWRDRVMTVEHGKIAQYTPDAVEGKDFLGWYFADGTKYMDTPVTQDMTLYGRWGQAQHTVQFDYNGGSGSENTVKVLHGEALTLPTATREGYKLTGWRDVTQDEELATTFYALDEKPVVTADMKFRAEWQINEFTVTFYIDDEVYNRIKVEYGAVLYDVIVDVGIKQQYITDYGFVNIANAPEPVPLTEFFIKDDVAVYLSEESAPPADDGNNTGKDDPPSDKDGTDIKTQASNFFQTIGRFFRENWLILTVSAAGIVFMVVVIVVAVKSRKR